MSIPRLAIHRPVTMFMLSGVIILLGWISFTRLPVDLMPDVTFPSVTVRVSYSGVGPLEMEELVTRPLEQQLSAIALHARRAGAELVGGVVHVAGFGGGALPVHLAEQQT